MGLYPLGISRSRDVPSVVNALAANAADVHWSHEGELACAYVATHRSAVEPARHAAALDLIHARISVLPVPFGVTMRDETELRDLLRSRHDSLLAQLARLDWTCEMSLRISLPSSPTRRSTNAKLATSTPASSLTRRLHGPNAVSVSEQDRSVVQHIVEHLHGTYREWRRLRSSPSQPIRLSFLVERGRVHAFQSRLAESQKLWRNGRCEVLGPWPPYSFV